jgi:hypothetical protein
MLTNHTKINMYKYFCYNISICCEVFTSPLPVKVNKYYKIARTDLFIGFNILSNTFLFIRR